MIFHAVRGCQYTSAQFANVAAELDVRHSVGSTGVCWNNASRTRSGHRWHSALGQTSPIAIGNQLITAAAQAA